ncbi:DNA-binding transcriptional regulator, LysR family [Nocardia amikacinitolerans]|uniref:DNA-binding transcriptional regulator, LysR family n=1 Tax=Nocardia amikacinitolerans TaxID=756689 RepID=A0A285LZ69_9NOCA|nr:LysR family transcriptional regulator [Nocardia amikacinitolerans]MCP2299524.1 DNA-binding transcriptional regulator, LysR family [Nocardia amikacinitolerans]SNY88601.1 DNA-binding transcriptional regulator, LysR family [Nocardia amikacinitolerans]
MSQVESIDVERLRWFVAVAEELHFARAAKSLGIARQRLSRAVIDLETELGTKLFVPGAQPTQLTDEGRELLAAARAVIARREVAEPEPEVTAELRVGFVPGVTVSKWERIWAERFPEVPLRTIPLAAADQLTALRDGRVDMCFVRLPIDREGLSAIPLYREVPVVVVPKEHPISLFTEVTAAELADERMQDASDIDAAAVTFEMVAAGVGLAIVPHSIARLHARRDLVYRTVTDHPDTEIALAWPTAETTELVEEFVGVVRGRSERSSRSPSTSTARQPKTATKKPVAQKKSAAGKSATPARGARSSGAKKPSKRRGR